MKCNYLKYVSLCIFLLASSLHADWSDPITIPNSSSYFDIRVVVDSAENATAVWRTNELTVQTATKTLGGDWSEPEIISNISQNSANPRIVIDPAGNVTAVWNTFGGNSILVSASKPFGGVWSPAVELTSELVDSTLAQIAVDATGNVTVLFTERSLTSISIKSVNKPLDGSWSAVEDVSNMGDIASIGNITADPSGVLTAVWIKSALGNNTVQSKTKNFGGSWSVVEEITSSALTIGLPTIAADSSGNVTAVWLQGSVGNFIVKSSTKPFNDSWEPVIDISLQGNITLNPNLNIGPTGNATALWALNGVVQAATKPQAGDWSAVSNLSNSGEPSTGGISREDQYGNITVVYLNAVSGIGTYKSVAKSSNGNWSDAINISPTASNVSLPSVAIDSSGRVIAVLGQAGSLLSTTYQPPVLSGLAPSAGALSGGNTVEITGAGFGSTTAVFFGTAPATFVINSPTSITATAPQGASLFVDVKVVTSNGISSPITMNSLYTYTTAPPSNFVGKIKKNIFLNKTDRILMATWTPSISSDVAYYVIYRGNQAVNVVQANGPFIFEDKIKQKSTNYFIKAVAANGEESALVPLVIIR